MSIVRMSTAGAAALAICALAVAVPGRAQTFVTPTGSTIAGLPVDATAVFTNEGTFFQVQLTNNEANPTSIAQSISDLIFTVSSPITGTPVLDSQSGQLINIASHAATNVAGDPTHWHMSTQTGAVYLDDIGGMQPINTIIGPGPYTNANGSINGNTSHNPFISQTGTFDITVPGMDASTFVTGATFSFNSTTGDNITGNCDNTNGGCGGGGRVPEPGVTAMLAGLVAVGLSPVVRRIRGLVAVA